MLIKKIIFLFLALVLPIGIFLFLKYFGKNEFAVQPLYSTEYPVIEAGCPAVKSIPYSIPDSVMIQLPFENADLLLLQFGSTGNESANQTTRIQKEFTNDPVKLFIPPDTQQTTVWRRCVFFLKEPFDLALVDRHGVIRGQYTSNDREDVDRLVTELSILLKKY
jgi:hypothetical protein